MSGNSLYKFFMVTEYNHDTYHMKEGADLDVIAKYYFRLEIDVHTHFRNLYGIMDFVSDVGGTSKAIMATLVAILGGASFFTSRVELMLHLYSDEGLFKFFDTSDLKDSGAKNLTNKL